MTCDHGLVVAIGFLHGRAHSVLYRLAVLVLRTARTAHVGPVKALIPFSVRFAGIVGCCRRIEGTRQHDRERIPKPAAALLEYSARAPMASDRSFRAAESASNPRIRPARLDRQLHDGGFILGKALIPVVIKLAQGADVHLHGPEILGLRLARRKTLAAASVAVRALAAAAAARPWRARSCRLGLSARTRLECRPALQVADEAPMSAGLGARHACLAHETVPDIPTLVAGASRFAMKGRALRDVNRNKPLVLQCVKAVVNFSDVVGCARGHSGGVSDDAARVASTASQKANSSSSPCCPRARFAW